MPNKRKTLAERIKELRTKAGLTQESLAKRVGVSPGAVAQWETGATGPRRGSIEALAAALGVRAADLASNEEARPALRAPTPEEMALYVLEAFRLPEDKLGAIRAILSATEGEMIGISAACSPVVNRLSPRQKDQGCG